MSPPLGHHTIPEERTVTSSDTPASSGEEFCGSWHHAGCGEVLWSGRLSEKAGVRHGVLGRLREGLGAWVVGRPRGEESGVRNDLMLEEQGKFQRRPHRQM